MVRYSLVFMLSGLLLPSSSEAATIFQSGTLGQIGVPYQDVFEQNVLGANISVSAFNGVRFELTETVQVSGAGGHLVSPPDSSSTMFAAIVALEGHDDFPDSEDLSTSDFLDSSVFSVPGTSGEIIGPLDLTLQPGWYALVIGSGLFGATGSGAALLNNSDVGGSGYLGRISGFGWGERPAGMYFVVEGTVIPEPTGLTLTVSALLLVAAKGRSIFTSRNQEAMVVKSFIVFLVLITAAPSTAHARTILFESGKLGSTGLPYSDIFSGAVPSSTVGANVFTGVKFQIEQPAITSEIGGHFVGTTTGTFFGAIIELSDENDLPDSGDLKTTDVLGNAKLVFPNSSEETFADLAIPLHVGWYALVFGGGLFDTVGSGAALANNPDIDSPEYIGFQPAAASSGWVDISSAFSNFRFVVNGQFIPEPSSLTSAILCLFCLLSCKRS